MTTNKHEAVECCCHKESQQECVIKQFNLLEKKDINYLKTTP